MALLRGAAVLLIGSVSLVAAGGLGLVGAVISINLLLIASLGFVFFVILGCFFGCFLAGTACATMFLHRNEPRRVAGGEAADLIRIQRAALLAKGLLLESNLPTAAPGGADAFRSTCVVCLQPLARFATWPLYARILQPEAARSVALFLGEAVRATPSLSPAPPAGRRRVDDIGEGGGARCPHIYHAECIELWLGRSDAESSCPVCRRLLL